MRFLWLCLAAVVSALLLASHGYARDYKGLGRLLTNDVFATIVDDRWRTGSGVLSWVWARGDLTVAPGGTPPRFGDIVEFRFRGEVISPENIVTPAAGDRPYASALSFGVHNHFTHRGYDVSVGADFVVIGPQTGLQDLQAAIHNIIDVPEASALTLANQIPNQIHASVFFEASRPVPLSETVMFRPFVELQGGVETLARVGGDFHFGLLGRNERMLRDVTTGHRYRVGQPETTGWAAVLGADVAYVTDSLFLPPSSGVTLTNTRSRVRAGVHWQNEKAGVFYGLTWLSKEFEAQTEGQLVGSFRLDFRF
ncbi:MAG: lipid A-modifier LpxR family protein [Pseudomonadota bacterium]